MLTALALPHRAGGGADGAPPSPRSPRAAPGIALGSVVSGAFLMAPGSPLRRAASSHASPPPSPRKASPPAATRRAALAAIADAGEPVTESSALHPLHPLSEVRPSGAPASAVEASLFCGAACVVCFEELDAPATPRLAAAEAAEAAAARSARSGEGFANANVRALPPLRSALPADLPCGHACCAECLAAHLARAVPRAARAAPRRPRAVANANAAAAADADDDTDADAARPLLLVRCPGLVPHDAHGAAAGGWDLRCPTALPAALLTPFLPAAPSANRNAEDDADARRAPLRAASLLGLASSAAYLWARTKRCPHCGAPSERAGGCRFVVCAACARDWCWQCNGPHPDDCACAAALRGRMELEETLRELHVTLSAAARWHMPSSVFVAAAAAAAANDAAASASAASSAAPDIEAASDADAAADTDADADVATPAAAPPAARGALRSCALCAAWCASLAALIVLGLPLYVLFCAVWVLPYCALSLVSVDAVAAAAAAGAPPPHDALEALPHVADALARAAGAALAAACGDAPAADLTALPPADAEEDARGGGGGEARRAPEWRQPNSVPARCAKALFVSLFALLATPPVAALWLAAAPLRFVSALVTPPEAFDDDA
jgi:hypothetical protein